MVWIAVLLTRLVAEEVECQGLPLQFVLALLPAWSAK